MAQEQNPKQAQTGLNSPDPNKVKISHTILWFAGAMVLILIAAIVVILITTGNDVTTTAAPATLSSEAQAGKTLFVGTVANCNKCHFQEGRAGGVGPRLSTIDESDDAIRRVVRNGTGGMPANKQLSDTELNKIIAYIRAIKPT